MLFVHVSVRIKSQLFEAVDGGLLLVVAVSSTNWLQHSDTEISDILLWCIVSIYLHSSALLGHVVGQNQQSCCKAVIAGCQRVKGDHASKTTMSNSILKWVNTIFEGGGRFLYVFDMWTCGGDNLKKSGIRSYYPSPLHNRQSFVLYVWVTRYPTLQLLTLLQEQIFIPVMSIDNVVRNHAGSVHGVAAAGPGFGVDWVT